MKQQKLLHYCKNTEAHSGRQHGFYTDLGKAKLTAKIRHFIHKKKIIPPRCPVCKSRDVVVGKIVTRKNKDGA